MASVFKVLAGISRPPRAPIKFSVDEDVTVKELAIKDRTSDTTEAIIKMLQFGYNESFLNIYRSIFGGIVIPLVLGIIMFWINFFIDSWAVSLTVSPLTIIPALLIYLNKYKLSSKRLLYRELREFFDDSDESARGRHVYVAMYKNYRIIGHLASAPYHRQTAQLHYFFVRKEYRNHGVGKKLVDAVSHDLNHQRYRKLRFGINIFQTEFLEKIQNEKNHLCRLACTKRLGTVIPFYGNFVHEFVMDL